MKLILPQIENRKTKLNGLTRGVYNVINSKWPTNPYEVAKELGENGGNKVLSAKYLYHFRKLKEMDLIHMKKVGNTYVAWPVDMERLRVVHEMIRDEG